MSSIVDKLIRFGEELAETKSSAYDLWTWLPSHREAKKHHGDYACEFTPPIQTVMIETRVKPLPSGGGLSTCRTPNTTTNAVDVKEDWGLGQQSPGCLWTGLGSREPLR